MSCHCSCCSRNKQISTLRQTQPERCTRGYTGPKGSKPATKKVLMDRFLAAKKGLQMSIGWYQEGRRLKIKYSFLYQPISRNSYYAKRYRIARANAKKAGLLK